MWVAEPPKGGVAALPTTSAGGDFGDSGSWPRSRLDRRVVSLCGRGADVAMRGRIHQSLTVMGDLLQGNDW